MKHYLAAVPHPINTSNLTKHPPPPPSLTQTAKYDKTGCGGTGPRRSGGDGEAGPRAKPSRTGKDGGVREPGAARPSREEAGEVGGRGGCRFWA